ncbi:MAG: hypothetical protein K2P58_13555 [Hyphomonadaceae bacterium]|nr:hypothetical protein [Hyphomonadaceae bacterium]
MAFAIIGCCAALAGCLLAGGADDVEVDIRWSEMPRQLRFGEANMVVERVEQPIEEAEVLASVQRLVARQTTCFSWPALWLDPEGPRGLFVVRYDLMTRDWGGDVAEASHRRMQEFVDQGFLIEDPAQRGEGVARYRLTETGAARLNGSPYRTQRAQFCAPVERRVVAITNMQWGEFSCGNLRVQFTHVADDWPSWARSEESRRRVAQRWGAVGVSAPGFVTLARQWFRPEQMPADMLRNGELRSVCFDEQRRTVIGDDLTLGAAASAEGGG